MPQSHFRVLYRQFLFRLMDVEFLAASARGDASQLFGQFAALLATVSLALTYASLIFMSGGHRLAPEIWLAERLLIEATMLAVGIFAILSWDSTFPDRRDVQILVPLPVEGRALFMAKVAASASALGLTIVALHVFSGLFWPLVLFRATSGAANPLRFLAAFWITLPCASLFLYCVMLGVQGIVAQLPRGWFLRISSFLQLAFFALFISIIFLQPSFITAKSLGAPENQRMLAWLPPYWFLGLFNKLSGGSDPAMTALANRAIAGLLLSILIAGAAFVLSWLRTTRKIAEEPDILPGARGGIWLPLFGSRPQTALVQFIIRTLARSRQHRMNLAFYLGSGFAMVAISTQAGGGALGFPMNTSLLVSSLLMLCVAVTGVRVAFSRPLDLRANWLFKVLPIRGGTLCLSSTRRALLALAVLPVWLGSAVALFRFWPWPPAVKHLLLLALLGGVLVEIALLGFRKIPFACSFLPGKSQVHIIFVAALFLLPVVLVNAAEAEQWAASSRLFYADTALGLAAAIIAVRRLSEHEEEILFEDFSQDELVTLGL